MLLLTLGLVVFLGSHVFTTQRQLRAGAIESMGAGGYKLAYSAVSAVGLLLIIWGYGVYRAEAWTPLWNAPTWTRHLALLVMVPVFPLLFASYLPGRIRSTVRHPMIIAVKTWALAHLLANGDLGSLLLFGTFLAWGVLALVSMKRRTAAEVSLAKTAPPSPYNDVVAVLAGLAVYVAFVTFLHRWLIGINVIG